MTELSKHFQYLLKKNGVPANSDLLDERSLSELSGKLPQALLDFWQLYGVGEWFGGLLRFSHPKEFNSVLALWFGADGEFTHREFHVVARNAFGDLFLWAQRHHSGTIRSTESQIDFTGLFKPEELAEADIDVYLVFSTNDPKESFDHFDVNDKPLFERCVARFGPLERDEIYGFTLPLALGGARTIENLGKVKAKEHLMILAQTQPLNLMDYSIFPPRLVRQIG
jgi:hypothetical protein